MTYTFKQINSLEKRIAESTRLREKYPGRVPVICEKFTGDKYLPELSKTKYIFPANTTVGHFLFTVRSNIHALKPHLALFAFVNNTSPPVNSRLDDLYDSFKDSDGFLYVLLSSESVFGKQK